MEFHLIGIEEVVGGIPNMETGVKRCVFRKKFEIAEKEIIKNS